MTMKNRFIHFLIKYIGFLVVALIVAAHFLKTTLQALPMAEMHMYIFGDVLDPRQQLADQKKVTRTQEESCLTN